MPSPQHYGSVGVILAPEQKPLQEDDKCWLLTEEDRFVNNNTARHRFQLIQVVRNHELFEFDVDMGPAEDFECGPFAIWSGGEDYVGNVLEMAIQRRVDNDLQRVMDDHLSEVNIIEQLMIEEDQSTTFAKRNLRTTRRLTER